MKENIQTDTRPSKDQYFMSLAKMAATRSTCLHRHQGAVIVKDNCVVSTGYNGSPPGVYHCSETICTKGTVGICRAEGLHGESNAIVFAAKLGISVAGATLYCVYSPCRGCCNIIKTAGIKEVVYGELYDKFTECPLYLTKTLGIINHMPG